jgi:aspartyl-tRNA(Asn)/glutamyl-tRNA(Gln) amidotransferase subunit A
MSDLCFSSIDSMAPRLQKGEVSPVELTQAYLDRIHALDGDLRAYVNLMEEDALEEARTAEQEIRDGRYRGPLHGIPVAVKDQYDVAGAPSMVRIPQPAGPGEDCEAVRRLRGAGAVMLGKLNMSGLPGGVKGARNPWNLDHVPGGSSTGSGAGIAAGLCMGSLGEDTAGSIRNPASFCGISGLKPTYGRVSRFGLAPLGFSLDTVGPMTRVVEDLAHMLQVLAGFDSRDPTSSHVEVTDYSADLRAGVAGMVVGVPRDYFKQVDTDPEVLDLLDQALAALESLGARVRDVTVPSMEYATIANGLLYSCEFYNICRADMDAAMAGEASESRRARLFIGAVSTSGDYIQAQRMRSRLRRELNEVFRDVHVLALPTNPAPAPLASELDGLDAVNKMLGPDYPSAANLAGIPALAIPSGFSSKGLPVGMQLWGKAFAESTVLRVGYAYQQHARWFERRPPE